MRKNTRETWFVSKNMFNFPLKIKILSLFVMVGFVSVSANTNNTFNNRDPKTEIRKIPSAQVVSTENPELSQPERRTVTGTVTDFQQVPLPGVNVVEAGTTTGTITDTEGNYSITVRGPESVISYSFVGYVKEEIMVGNQTHIDVTLLESRSALDEVVVVGYGIQKKESIVGSIVQTKAEDLIKTGNVQSVNAALQGLLPGVTSLERSGFPGSSEAKILIRGVSTWGDNSPLIIVDGVERDFENINVNDVESISVLKDASATAVFGVKAANGVIMLTTKRGVIGKPVFNYSSSYTFKSPVVQHENYYAPFSEALRQHNIAAMNDYNYGALAPQSFIDEWSNPNRDPRLYTYTDWVDYMFGNGHAHQHNISMRGGNNFVKYYTSFGYDYDGGIEDAIYEMPEFDPRRRANIYTYRSNLDFQLTKTTELGVRFAGEIKNVAGNGPGAEQGTYGYLWYTPMVGPPIQFETGEWGTMTGQLEGRNWASVYQSGETKSKTNRLFADLRLTQDLSALLDGLRAEANFSFGNRFQYQQSISQTFLRYYYDPDLEKLVPEGSNVDIPDESPVTIGSDNINSFSRNLYYDVRLNYDKQVNNHEFGALALFMRRESSSGVVWPSYEESWVGRATYSYATRYLFEVNGAYNGSEKFAPGLRFGFFPSMAVGWVLTNEPFMQDRFSALSYLKFRYSYGEIGSDAGAQRWTYVSLFNERDDHTKPYFGDPIITSPGPVYAEGSPANPNATWERAIKQNLGIETGFFDNKLTLTVDLWDEYRDQILMTRRIIPVWYGGNGLPDGNVGEVKNHGIDIELGWRHQVTTDVLYWFKGSLALSENRVVFRDDLPFAPDYQKAAGKPVGARSDLLLNGYLQSWDEVYRWTQSSFSNNLIPGDFKYIDYNADGLLSVLDNAPSDSGTQPLNSFSFSLGGTIKQFSIVARFNGIAGIYRRYSRILWPQDVATSYKYQYFPVDVPEIMDFWTPDNRDATRPNIHLVESHNKINSQFRSANSSYLRFRTLEVNYKVKQSALDRTNTFSNLEFYVSGNNLYTWQHISRIHDPENETLLMVYPLVRRFSIGVRASF